WEAETEGKIPVTADELRSRADSNKRIWLVTLNACESATETKDARSLANELVGQGFPAAIGMREKADASYAHKFCRLFYRGVVKTLQALPEGGQPEEIEWAAVMYEARTELGAQCQPAVPLQVAARACKHWTIPALYTRPEPFKIKRIPPKPGLTLADKKVKLQERRELVRERDEIAADPSTPQEIKAGILKEFDEQIKALDASLKG
ncbi:MAG: CHAT domain-containing protein, partial [Acidobacteriaceae bacterium]|nr:CHAT domain-containing protein [Acidobacteriaceae bacterium]